jgi:hypothetical protein
LRKTGWLFGSAVLVLCSSLLMVSLCHCSDYSYILLGEARVSVYVIDLSDVGGNATEAAGVTQGAVQACQINESLYLTELHWPTLFVLGQIGINTSVTVVRDWDFYKYLVESGYNITIVNAHGEMVPVPSGYTKEAWVDRIAEAMLNRSVTWVHTAGYPFYYYYLEEVGNGTWGEAGFQRLMGHIGLENVTCTWPYSQNDRISMSTDVDESLGYTWLYIYDAAFVQRGNPLNNSVFKNYLILPIWGTYYENDYTTGAIVRFSLDNQSSPGIYVHIGTNQTFDTHITPSDADYLRGYAGAAAAIWSSAFRVVSEKKSVDAEEAIVEAETEGRTKGLDKARQLLDEAGQNYRLGQFVDALESARQAQVTANEAVSPSFIESYGAYLAVTLTAAAVVVIGSGVTLRWRRNHKK